eukprot:TRINITY_DN5584_c0_g1_i15.p1 TRINITY_DN5584_c0_g1~~TRINITY_DN5584_c0_g1_i15.p1  ORF type:complete len:453 (-),score=57.95 TRINITY_DN5584_c0_g1_i15:42-1400(-)
MLSTLEMIVPPFYQFLKVNLLAAAKESPQPEFYQVVKLWVMFLQPWQVISRVYFDRGSVSIDENIPSSLFQKSVKMFQEMLRNYLSFPFLESSPARLVDKPKGEGDMSKQVRRNKKIRQVDQKKIDELLTGREFQMSVVRPYVWNHLAFYTYLFRLFLSRAQDVVQSYKEQKALLRVVRCLCSVKGFLEEADSMLNSLQAHNSFISGTSSNLRGEATLIQHALHNLETSPYRSIFSQDAVQFAQVIFSKLKSNMYPVSVVLRESLNILYQFPLVSEPMLSVNQIPEYSGILREESEGLGGRNVAIPPQTQPFFEGEDGGRPIRNPDGSFTEYGRERICRGIYKCSKENVVYKQDPRFQPVRSYENSLLCEALISFSKRMEKQTGKYYDLRFLSAYPTWLAFFTVLMVLSLLFFCCKFAISWLTDYEDLGGIARTQRATLWRMGFGENEGQIP